MSLLTLLFGFILSFRGVAVPHHPPTFWTFRPRCVESRLQPQQLIVKPLFPGELHVFLDQVSSVKNKQTNHPHAVVTAASTAAEGRIIHSASLPACLGIAVDKRQRVSG